VAWYRSEHMVFGWHDSLSETRRDNLILGKCIVVTGGGRGIGLEIVKAFAKEGAAAVCIVDRDANTLKDSCATLSVDFPDVKFHAIAADVTSSEDRQRLLHEAQATGQVTVLVNNAGIEQWGSYDKCDVDSIDAQLQANLVAPMHLTRAFLPRMLSNGQGFIVNIASIAGKGGAPKAAAYSASKHGLVGFTRSLCLELDGRGVSCCAICPGFAPTQMLKDVVDKACGTSPPWTMTTSVHAVAAACVRAVVCDKNEIIVNATPLRGAFALNEMFPGIPLRLLRSAPNWLSGASFFRSIA